MTLSFLYLKDTDIAIRYGISRATIWRWVKNNKFPRPIKLGAGSTRWRLSDLEIWEQIQSQRAGL
jgi:predicted DNA-binding transcriptional regulator AlpA